MSCGSTTDDRLPQGHHELTPTNLENTRVHGTKHTTIIRNVHGDMNAFIDELRAVLQLPLGKKGILTTALSTGPHGGGEAGRGVTYENPIRIRAGGNIEIHGDRLKEVKRWLAELGF